MTTILLCFKIENIKLQGFQIENLMNHFTNFCAVVKCKEQQFNYIFCAYSNKLFSNCYYRKALH